MDERELTPREIEALHEVKDRYFTAMAAQITRHGGKIEKYIGDAIMAVFGLPVQHEDDALRAVRAAAGMQAALRSVNVDLAAHYGIELAMRMGGAPPVTNVRGQRPGPLQYSLDRWPESSRQECQAGRRAFRRTRPAANPSAEALPAR